MRIKLGAVTHPIFCTIQFLEDVYRSDPYSWRSECLLGGIRCRMHETYSEGVDPRCNSGFIGNPFQAIPFVLKGIGRAGLPSGLGCLGRFRKPCLKSKSRVLISS